MEQHGTKISQIIMLPIFCGFCFGCVSLATDFRKVGFSEFQRGFATLKRKKDLNEVLVIQN